MSNTFNTRIQCKKDSESEWEDNNPVLLDGEIAVVVSNDGKIKFKVGDGMNHYSVLNFASEATSITWRNWTSIPEGEA